MEGGDSESGMRCPELSFRSQSLNTIHQLPDSSGITRSGHHTILEGDMLTSVLLQNQMVEDQAVYAEDVSQEHESIQTQQDPTQVQGQEVALAYPPTESGSTTTTAQPNSSYASELHFDINQIVKSGRVFAYWITALSFAGIISIICVYLEDKTSDKIHKPLFTACILFVGASFTTGLGLIALLGMSAHFSTHNLIQSFIVLHKTLECCGLGFVALAFGTGSSLLFGKMLVNLIFIISIVIIAIRLALMFCCNSNGNSSEDAV